MAAGSRCSAAPERIPAWPRRRRCPDDHDELHHGEVRSRVLSGANPCHQHIYIPSSDPHVHNHPERIATLKPHIQNLSSIDPTVTIRSKMLVHIPLLALVLGLLPYLADARAEVPVFSTLRSPFVLRTQGGFHVALKHHRHFRHPVPVITRNRPERPEFRLKEGNLTTQHEGYAAVYSIASTLPEPPPLVSIYFEKHPRPRLEVPFAAATRYIDGRKTLRLWGLNGREWMISKTWSIPESD